MSTLSFHAGTAGDKTSGALFSSNHVWMGADYHLLRNVVPELLLRCGSADLDSFMVRARRRSATFSSSRSGILEQLVSRTLDSTSWTNSSLSLIYITFTCEDTPSLLKSVMSRTCRNEYRIWDDSYVTRYLPASQSITVQICDFRAEPEDGFFSVSALTVRKPSLGNHASEFLWQQNSFSSALLYIHVP